MLRRTESWPTDCSFVDDARLQQELHDLVYYAQTQKRKNALPRIDSVRFIRIGNAGQYGVSIELVLLKKNPESTSGAVQRIDVAVRIPARFPAEVPMISCTYGADSLPPELQRNGQLMATLLLQSLFIQYQHSKLRSITPSSNTALKEKTMVAVSQPSQVNQLSRPLLNGSNVRQILCSDFKVVKSIGAGSSCQVYLANWRGTDVAVKA
uniref:Uncharacterized protein n=1 Tax=Globisporangium ultimum (strain ATCC 200006 / CBS 805.95 / DAOM BR144) TaxID=431595 RepID=K3WPP7_GLOUD